MKLIIEQLKAAIKNHPIIRHSSLGNSQQWRRAQYIILSEIISENLSKSEFIQGAKKNELGTTISNVTLQRLFTDNYSDKENPDLRFLKTLDKLSIFLGYPSLNSFLAKDTVPTPSQSTLKEERNNEDLLSIFENLIHDYCKSEFLCLLSLPNIETEKLTQYLFENGPFYARIKDILIKHSQLKYKVNSNGNRSNFEIYDFNIQSVKENIAVVTTSEFWNIEWTDKKDKTPKVYNKINQQTYFIKKEKDQWKIWDNHNPDYKALLNEIATEMSND